MINVEPIVGIIPGEDKFDNNFFGMHYKLSLWVDPTAKHGFERSFEAIIDAGKSKRGEACLMKYYDEPTLGTKYHNIVSIKGIVLS